MFKLFQIDSEGRSFVIQMYRCRNCGELIDEHQMRNFQGICAECVRMRKNTTSDTEVCERTLWSIVMIAGVIIAVGSLGTIIFAFMTPFGLIALASVPVSIIVGSLLYWFGKKMRDEAEQRENPQY